MCVEWCGVGLDFFIVMGWKLFMEKKKRGLKRFKKSFKFEEKDEID